MAFSNNPKEDTYSTKSLELTKTVSTRPGSSYTKDIDYLNVLLEPVKHEFSEQNEIHIIKRQGTEQLIASQVASNVRGIYYWTDQQKIVYCANRHVYVYTIATASLATLTNFFTSTSGEVGFCEFLYDDTDVVLIITDGTTLKSIDSSNTIVTCSDPDLPDHLPNPIFLDGYLFLVKVNSADIYNSDLNDPMSWTSGDFLTAEMEGDLVKRLCKINNYLVAFGTNTIEYFWDAGNDTGSPLQRNDTPIKVNGYLAGATPIGNKVFFIGNSVTSEPSVFFLEDFKIQEVGNFTVRRYLTRTEDSYASWKAGILSFSGHSFYVINAGSNTLMFDLETKVWTRLAYQNTTSFQLICSTSSRPADGSYLQVFALENTTSAIYVFRPTLYRDSGVDFTAQIITDLHNFGTLNRKSMHRLALSADRTSSNSSISVSWSDDDYTTWSTALLINLNQDLQSCYRLGSFRQRAFKFTYTDNYPLRIQKVDVNINKGSS